MNYERKMKEILKDLGADEKDLKNIDLMMEKKLKHIDNILEFLMTSCGTPLEAVANGVIALSNISMAIADVDPRTDDSFLESCESLNSLLSDEGYSEIETLAILLTTASLIIGSADIKDPVIDTLKKKKESNCKRVSKVKAEVKKEASDLVDGLFDGDLSEQELAKRIASIISKSKQ